MSDLLKKIDEATTRISDLQKQRADLEAEAQAHEQAARECRLKMGQSKKEIEELATVLRHSQVQRSVETAQESARKAQSDAESALARLVEKEKQTDGALARLVEKEKQLDALLAEKARLEPIGGD